MAAKVNRAARSAMMASRSAPCPSSAMARAQAALAYLTYAGVEPARIRTTIRVEPTGGPAQRRVEVRLE